MRSVRGCAHSAVDVHLPPVRLAHLRDLVHYAIIGVMSDVTEFNMG